METNDEAATGNTKHTRDRYGTFDRAARILSEKNQPLLDASENESYCEMPTELT